MLSAIMVMTEEIKADQTKCYALALSSGDESAAYQAGALSGIFNSNLQPTDYQYDAISGISGGALNAVMLASFAKGSEKDAATRIEKFWVDASNS
jgi:predicted acylesterase/phospholipase RssA